MGYVCRGRRPRRPVKHMTNLHCNLSNMIYLLAKLCANSLSLHGTPGTSSPTIFPYLYRQIPIDLSAKSGSRRRGIGFRVICSREAKRHRFSGRFTLLFRLKHIFSPTHKTAQNKKHCFVNFKRK